MKKVLSVLLASLVFCFMAGPVLAQAEEANPVAVEFSLMKDYSTPLVIPTIFKLEPIMLQKSEAPEVEKESDAPIFFGIGAMIIVLYCAGQAG